MDLAEIPLFAMLRSRMGYLNERQKVIAQNVANADTARYVPDDLKPFSFKAKVDMARAGGTGAMATTDGGHLQPRSASHGGSGSAFKPVKSADSETTLNGNSVVLEEEMMKMSDARMNYDAAVGFYQKSLSLMRMATRAPGRGA